MVFSSGLIVSHFVRASSDEEEGREERFFTAVEHRKNAVASSLLVQAFNPVGSTHSIEGEEQNTAFRFKLVELVKHRKMEMDRGVNDDKETENITDPRLEGNRVLKSAFEEWQESFPWDETKNDFMQIYPFLLARERTALAPAGEKPYSFDVKVYTRKKLEQKFENFPQNTTLGVKVRFSQSISLGKFSHNLMNYLTKVYKVVFFFQLED